MAPQVLHRVIFGTIEPSAAQRDRLTIVPAILPHFIRHRVSHCDYPAIVSSSAPDASVRGTYVSGLTAQDQWRLDLFEGDQYDRFKVHPQLLDQEGKPTATVEAETYVWKDAEMGLENGEWDFEEFRKAKMGRWIGQDDEYEEVDEAVRDRKDPTGGRGLNGHITGKLEAGTENENAILEAAV
ncbi:hypothetical protein ACLMJK_001282 [Lecanora helva]